MRPSLFLAAAILLVASWAGADDGSWNEARSAAKAFKLQAMKTAEAAEGENAAYCRSTAVEHVAPCRRTRFLAEKLEELVSDAAMASFYIRRGEPCRALAERSLVDYDDRARAVEFALDGIQDLPLTSAEQVKTRVAYELVRQELSRIPR